MQDTGKQRGSMNLQQLRQRVEELQRSLNDVLQALVTPQLASAVRWNDVLDKFAVVNVQYLNMTEQMKPILKHFVVYPTSVGEKGDIANVLPIMLASKLLPEMEAEDATIAEDYDPSFTGLQIEQQLHHMTRLNNDHEKFTKIIDFLTVKQDDVPNTGIFDEKGSVRDAMAKNSKLISALAAMRAEQQRPQQGPPDRRQQDRKRKRDEGDILFSAILAGEGLRPSQQPPTRAGRTR